MMKFYFCVQKSALGTSTQLLSLSKIGILIIFHAYHPVAVPGCCAQLPSMIVGGKVANLLPLATGLRCEALSSGASHQASGQLVIMGWLLLPFPSR